MEGNVTIDKLIYESCLNHAERTALRHKAKGSWQDITYRELWQQVDELANGLRQKQFKPGEHVALLAQATPRWIIAYLGILRSGGICIPIDKELKAAELRHIFVDSNATALFLDEQYLEMILELIPELPKLQRLILLSEPPKTLEVTGSLGELVEAWHELVEKNALPKEDVSRLEALTNKALNLLGNLQPKGGLNTPGDIFSPARRILQQMMKAGRLTHFDQLRLPGESPDSPRLGDETAVILYTSGTTGKSKGAQLSHDNILSNIDAAVRHLELKENVSTLSFLPINHVLEQVCGILLPLSIGGTVSFAESLKKLGENLAEIRPTFLLGVPAVYRLLLDRISKNIESKPMARMMFRNKATRPFVISRLRRTIGIDTKFFSGGAALDPGVAQRFQELGLQLYQGYGITETSPVIAAESPKARRPGSVGQPVSGVDIRIDNPQPDGIGEIVVKGPNVMQGYYNNHSATVEVLQDGWYRTGDLGHMDKDGFLYISGRMKNLIVTPNGKNFYPEEVENELLKSRFIAEAMVYGHKINPVAEEVCAVIYPNQDELLTYQREVADNTLSENDIQEIIRLEVLEACRQLADYKRVKRISLRDEEFPKTTTKKIKRFIMDPNISTENSAETSEKAPQT
ncbi:MAG: AMP-dependent synthetase [Desulfuromonas sp.]|nr:MAG: AMP-dependent synthetase [Desulfuromonas sp.]